MVTAPPDYQKAARMPTYDAEGRYVDPYADDSLVALQRISLHHSTTKQVRHIPRSNSSARRQKFSLTINNSPRISSRQLKSCDDCPFPSCLSPPSLSPPLSRKNSRKKLQRRLSRDRPDSKVYHSEADFLVQNQHLFTKEDFEAVLAALAEDSHIDEKRKQEERKSIQLAKELAVEDCDQRRSSTSSNCSSSKTESEDLEALVVALRAELDESDGKRRDEEESYRLACQLISDEAKECGVLHSNNSDTTGDSNDRLDAPCDIQCQACHFDIEKESMLRELPCGHRFHAFCINRWFLMNRNDCPYCRRKHNIGT